MVLQNLFQTKKSASKNQIIELEKNQFIFKLN